MAKYLLQDAGINWLAILALLTFVIVFTLALIMVFARRKDSYRDVAQQPLKDSYLLLLLAPAPSPPYPGPLASMSELELFAAFVMVLVILLGLWSLLDLSFKLMALQRERLLRKYHPEQLQEVGLEQLEPTKAWWQRLYERMTDAVPIEEEAAIVLNHEYDGVRELDNNLPPWWTGLFYVTIAIAPVYVYFVHFSDFALSPAEAYDVEMTLAEAKVQAYLKTQENSVDENNVVLLEEADAIDAGQMIFSAKCSPCHGKAAEGGIGPNLTDEYWLHGGSVNDVFRTIKNGVPEKGMIPWKNELRPRDIQEVASYILSLQSTNPANGKEPEGERYIAEATSK
ncbi:cytochrome c oxidase cbb3-type subunit 3 [Neolewinella xylanilytica]|uniref:Cytochrome c oxidase cbb3-type subunit 3 n=1 Tax=Neolewinella xylanilytica TaxID=1514080 RepID=A0A2S6I7Z0_9BACT|nr:cbb3-type cytochrome c oxidase N-terminal domain-containing protein [Neolewinella xylanilytica]PPK87602.1 cytochrome c oxidase cbb3-type subunit 3 [Neolewinella xylanilytica]